MKKCCGVYTLRIAVGITILALLLAGSANAANLTVCPSGCEYSSIQKAIKSSNNGDTIRVQSGTYFEKVKINKKLILRGTGNPVVDAGESGSAITLSANGITLEGFTATGSGNDQEAGIKVTSNSNTISGNDAFNNKGVGISLEYDSNNNTLIGNNASNNDNGNYNYGSGGISLSHSSNNTLIGNNASNNRYGIHLSFSNNNTLSSNIASNNTDVGIYLEYASNNILTGNNASNNRYGIQISTDIEGEDGDFEYYCTNNKLKKNIMRGNRYNFELDVHKDSDFQNQIDKSNLVDGKPIYYVNGAKNTVYDSSTNAGTFYCINCVNVTIKDLNLTDNGYGVFFQNTTVSKIQNVKVHNNNDYGIILRYSSNNMLAGNNASNNGINSGGGISLYISSDNRLITNNASNNGNEYGYYSAGISLISSSNNTLRGNNAFNNNRHGIALYYSINNSLITNNASSNGNETYYDGGISLSFSSSNKLIGNNANSNKGYGIDLQSSRYNKWGHNNALIANNASNNKYGISLSFSNSNKLIGNNASNNNIGISLSSSRKNKINNNIFNNTNNFDFHNNKINTWNTNKQSGTNIIGGPILGGNFWGYPNGTGFSQICKDVNNNGICEKRYILDENNIDHLPLSMNFTKDISPPKSVSNLKNVTYAKNFINWTWTDPKNIDFKKVMVFIDNTFKRNVSKGKKYYNATNFTPNTKHTISTWTVDMNGNINKTWKNSSAWTAK